MTAAPILGTLIALIARPHPIANLQLWYIQNIAFFFDKAKLDVGDEILTHHNGEPRSTESIMLEVNRAFEAAIRRDPANWFWVHKRWKPGKWKTPKPNLHLPGDEIENPAVGEKRHSQ